MKRILPLILAITFLLSAVGCGDDTAKTPDEPDAPVTTVLDTDYDIAPHIHKDGGTLAVSSPDKALTLTLSLTDGQLTYRVSRDNTVYIEDGTMGLTLDGVTYGRADALGEAEAVLRTDIRTLYGKTAKADAPCVQAVIPVGGMTLETRIYDDGVAFRYVVAGDGKRKLQSEETSFPLPQNATLWAIPTHQFYETFPTAYKPSVNPSTTLGMPATVQLANGGYLALTEGDLSHYPGAQLEWQSADCFKTAFLPGTYALSGTVTTPWRIISVADDLNELVGNTIVYQVNDAAEAGLYESVKPGRATWSWITGRTTDAVRPDVMETYTDHAAALGFEYNIIDEGWINWTDSTLETLAKQGDAYGVGQILWSGMTSGASFNGGIDTVDEAKAYLDFVAARGMKGAKIDFFRDERHIPMGVDIYEEILAYAAKLGLVINFHGCNKPTGQDATYPNELNREAIYGLENMSIYNYSMQAEAFVTQPFVRNLAGHADFTPAVESAFQMAQLVIADAPMQAFGSDPEVLFELDCLEMIKSVPTVWQDTVVLEPSEIGKSAVFARKGSNASWYVGGINYMGGHESVTLTLSDFLGEGTYTYELWTDDGNRFAVDSGTVTANDTLTVPFEMLSGFIVRFDRLTLSQYGGAINAPVTLHTADPANVVRYTLDGSKPTDASPVWESGTALTLTDSCTLTLIVTEGPDSGAVASYRFNNLS